jgi:hypothetical protein
LLDLREKLDEGILVGDGVIDTLLADRGVAQPYGVREKLAPYRRGLPDVAGLDAASGEDVVEAVS